MPRSLPPLTSLRTFEAAARLGSFARAARELHVTPAAVSHQIRGLEEYLGVTLFHRTTRKLVATDHALAAADSLRDAFERMGQGVEQMRSNRRTAGLSISVTPAFATRWLVGRLSRFQKQHPRVHLRLVASASPVDFEQEDVDLAIRIGRGAFDGVAAFKLFHEWVAPVASPAFLRRHRLRRPLDAGRVPLLHDDSMRRAGRPQGWTEYLRTAGTAAPQSREGMHFDDGHLALQAAASGLGLALGRMVYAFDDLQARRLRIALGPVVEMDLAYYLLVPESRLALPAIDVFREWLEAEAANFRGAFQALLARHPASRLERRGR